MKEYAEAHGGELLSSGYTSAKDKYLWRCAKGHRWESRACDLCAKDLWCPICDGRRHRYSLVEMQDIAASRNGECLSDEYVNTQSRLMWKCAHGHVWEAVPQSVINGSWCPVCSTGLGERLTRAVFEQLFSERFERSYPEWLTTDDGIQLELDGYNALKGLAFEHQGSQHYASSAFFSLKMPFHQRQQYDARKRRLCKEHDVVLVEVPEVGTRTKLQDLQLFIESELEKNGIVPPNRGTTISYVDAYTTDSSCTYLHKLRAIAAERGGSCLETVYKGSKAHHLFRCSEGHEWATTAESVFAGKWCPYCSAKKKADVARTPIETLQDYAKRKGGQLVSASYRSGNDLLEWECARGHRWKAKWNNIRMGKWCPYCWGDRLDELRGIAAERGGRLISDEYAGMSTPLEWECSKGHRWWAKPNNIKNGTWCPHCAHNVRASIEDMQRLAASKGGECLSSEYVNARTKLKWRCAFGHEWQAVPHSIKAGTWCPVCAAKRARDE